MLGTNKILGPDHGSGSYLKIHSIFDTIQGEGIYAGVPAIFIRLSGCNLACTFCDTEFDSYNEMDVNSILDEVNNFSKSYKKLVVLTGGEPFRQPISLLCELLVEHGFKVQIETNGLLYRKIPESVSVVCSPKNTGNGYQPIRADLLKHVKAIKFLISSNNRLYQGISNIGQEGRNIQVYVQPMDELDQDINKANLKLAIELSRSQNAILSLQIHKIIGLD
jgi:7-carboxy-7-deazaguanine synthase